MGGTASVPGWWVEFQAAVLRQLPRPGEIDQAKADEWSKNQKSLKQTLKGSLLPPSICSWSEQDSVIYLSVTSDGTTGPQWIERLKGKGFRLSDDTKNLLRTPYFKPTYGVTTEIAILKGILFRDLNRATEKIRVAADKKGWDKPHWEVACLICDKFTDEQLEQMGLWYIVTMHEPINYSGGNPRLLCFSRNVRGRWFWDHPDLPDGIWGRNGGFAFAVSQVSSQR